MDGPVSVKDYVSLHSLRTVKDPEGLEKGYGYISERGGARAIFYHNGEPMAFLACLEFVPGLVRADHYHLRKLEHMVVVRGTVIGKFVLRDAPDDVLEVTLGLGDIVSVAPGCVHSYRSDADAMALEYSPNAFEAADTYSYPIPW
jgi:quercetin dioxygenase-like cupin family protein